MIKSHKLQFALAKQKESIWMGFFADGSLSRLIWVRIPRTTPVREYDHLISDARGCGKEVQDGPSDVTRRKVRLSDVEGDMTSVEALVDMQVSRTHAARIISVESTTDELLAVIDQLQGKIVPTTVIGPNGTDIAKAMAANCSN